MAAALVAGAFLACPAVADDPPKPVLTVTTKTIEDSVYIDESFRKYRGLHADLLAEGRKQFDAWKAEADKELKENPESFSDGRSWYTYRDYSERSVIGRYVSVRRTDETSMGGAHPNISFETILWDARAGKRISIRPFFNETARNGPTMTVLMKAARLAVAKAKIERNSAFGKDPPEVLAANDEFLTNAIRADLLMIGPISLAPSTVSGKSSGLTFHYSPNVAGAIGEGEYTVFVPWSGFRTLLSPEGKRIFGGEPPEEK